MQKIHQRYTKFCCIICVSLVFFVSRTRRTDGQTDRQNTKTRYIFKIFLSSMVDASNDPTVFSMVDAFNDPTVMHGRCFHDPLRRAACCTQHLGRSGLVMWDQQAKNKVVLHPPTLYYSSALSGTQIIFSHPRPFPVIRRHGANCPWPDSARGVTPRATCFQYS